MHSAGRKWDQVQLNFVNLEAMRPGTMRQGKCLAVGGEREKVRQRESNDEVRIGRR